MKLLSDDEVFGSGSDLLTDDEVFGNAEQPKQPRDNFEAAKFAQEKADKTERSWGEVAGDTGLALAQGAMDFAALPGTLYGLATGNFDNAYSNIFRPGQDAADELKSDKLKAEQAALAAKVNAAEGWREKLAVGLFEGIQNGTLAADQLARMIPGIVGGGGVGRAAEKVITTGGQLAKAAPVAAAISGRAQPVAEAAASIVGKAGELGGKVAASPVGKLLPDVATAGAVGTGSAIQAQSVTEETLKEGKKIPVELFAENDPGYLPLVDQLVESGLTRGQAMLKARDQRVDEMAQTAGLQSFALSLLTQVVPGGSTIETAALKKAVPGSGVKAAFEGIVKGATREPVQEGLEEASGSAAKDLQLRQADPSVDVIGNAAAAGGQGAALGMLAGGAAGGLSARGGATPVGDGGAPTTAPGMATFSDPTGPAAQAGIRPVVVPIAAAAANGQAKAEEEATKAAESGKPTEAMVAKVNPELEQALGLDKLRMPNVGGTSVADAVPAAGGGVEGAQPGGSVVPAGPAVDDQLAPGASATAAAPSGGQVQPAAETGVQPAGALTPTKVWTGRRGDGYATAGDANVALQSKQQASSKEGGDGLRWTVVPQAEGRFVLHGYDQKQATQPADSRIQTEAPTDDTARATGQVLAGVPQAADAAGSGVAGAGGGVPGGRAATAGAATAAAIGSPTAPIHGGGEQAASLIDPANIAEDLKWVQADRQKRGEAIELEVVTSQQDPTLDRLATAMKAPIYFVRTKSGKSNFSGFARNGRIAVNLSGRSAPVVTVMHEAVHTMPQALRTSLIEKIMPELAPGARDEFLRRYPAYASRPEDKIQEEIVAKLTENATEEPAFWNEVKTKLGDKDYKALVKHILGTLARLIGAARAHNNKDLVRDWTKTRDLISTAVAKTMNGDTSWIDDGDQERATMDGAEVTEIDPDQVGDAEYAERGVEEDIGDYDVRSFKDGSLSVGGSVEEIRAALPEGVTGRIKGDRLLFTTSDAPRVMAALSGQKVAYSREGRVLYRKPMRAGKYIGAPAKYDSPSKITHLRKWMRQLADEGAPGRFWYENSSRAILNFVGGDVQEARKFVALLAIYSPQAKVDTNSTFALRAWSQYKAGHPIKVKTKVMDEKAREALIDIDKFWSGQKTGNFFNNLLREIDPTTAGKQGATIDMWMMRAAYYSSDAPTDTQYAFMEDEINRIAADLGWEPQQVQAAIWVAMKARMENSGVKKRTEASSERRGWIRFDRTAKGKPKRIILNKQKHRDNWLDHAFAHDPTQKDINTAEFDFEDGVRRHIGQVSWEAAPSVTNGILPGLHTAPWAQRVEFQQAVQQVLHDEHGDMLARYLGLLADDDLLAPGAWQGAVNPSMQIPVAMSPANGKAGKTSVDAAQKKLLNVYAATLGLVLHQDGVGWHRPFYSANKGDSNGLDILLGRVVSQTEMSDLYNAINDRMIRDGKPGWQDDMALISSPTGVRVINFGVITNKELQTSFLKGIEPSLPDAKVRLFASDGDMPTNKWRVNPNGQTYIDRLSAEGRPDVLEWARAVLSPRVQRVFDEFSERYGWGESDISFSEDARPAEPPRGSNQVGAGSVRPGVRGSVTGVHYGQQAGLSILSGRMFGQGIRGKEQARLAAATDERIKRRVYFYLTNNGQDMPAPEAGLGQHVYRAELGNLYDGVSSTREERQRIQGLRKGTGDNEFESAILDAGYRGFVNREQGTAVVLNSDVPVAYEGTINWAQVRPRVNERIVPTIETRQEGGELVRKVTNEQMLGVVKARPELTRVAPSFRLQYGEARVAAEDMAAANAALADSGLQFSEDITQSRLPFYSALDRAIEGGPKQAPPEQWLAFIKGLPGKGVKPDEIFWSGIEDWLKLQDGKVQRDVVRAFLASSGVKVEETVLSSGMTEEQARKELAEKYFVGVDDAGRLIDEDENELSLAQFAPDIRAEIKRLRDIIDDNGTDDAPKYGEYTLPGGKNYREVLLALNPRVDEKRFGEIADEMNDSKTTGERYAELYSERARLTDATRSQDFRSSHWDEKNVIAHIRLNDRIIDGKKTLFVEEFQSDWAQAGKHQRDRIVKSISKDKGISKENASKEVAQDAGFAKPSSKLITKEQLTIAHEAMAQVLRENDLLGFDTIAEARGAVYGDSRGWRDYYEVTDEEAEIINRWIDMRRAYLKQENESGELPPIAPFVTATDKWLGLAIKRVLVDAAKGDYAQVAFVNGQQSVDRYSLEKHVDMISGQVMNDGAIFLVARKNHDKVMEQRVEDESKLEEYIGKEVADRLLKKIEEDGTGYSELRGLDLKVGGTGMKTFYDSIVPSAVNSVIKRFGGKVAPIAMARYTVEPSITGRWNVLQDGAIYETKPTEQIARALADRQNGEVPTQMAFEVTPEMKAKIDDGLPLFSEDAADYSIQQGMRRESWGIGRDELGRPTFGAGAKAYEMAAAIANNVLDKVKMKPISPELDRAMRKMKVEIEKAQLTAVDVANKLKEIPKDELEMISDVIEGELKAGVVPPQRVYDIAASMISIMREQSAELIRLGMLSAEAAGRWDGKYLPRFYETKLLDDLKAWKKAAAALTRRPGVMQGVAGKSLKARGIFETVEVKHLKSWEQQGWEVRDPKYKPGDEVVQIWRDYTRQEREDMGEVRDAMFRFIMGYTRTQRDIQLGRLFERLAADVAVAGPRPGFVEVPSTKIEGTFAPRYGKLSGMYVPTEVLDHIKSYDDAMHNEILKMYRKGLSLWKEGKALALDTPIPTPTGWTTMGEISEGDKIFDELGQQCEVIFATPIQFDRECFEVEFSDGEKIVADAEHLWLTTMHGKPGVRMTTEILATLKERTRGDNNHSIPVAGELQTANAELLVPPYALGVWLGDGHSSRAEITSCELDYPAMTDNLTAAGMIATAPKPDKRSTALNFTLQFDMAGRSRKEGLQPTLRSMGLFGNKHIPASYLRASQAQRRALLQGLMDTDGSITERGQCEFSTTVPALNDGVLELLRSLGYKPASAPFKTAAGTQAWRLKFQAYADEPVFLLPRKATRLKPRPATEQRSSTRQIVAITPVASAPVRCIQVSSKSRLYLAGRGMIPTHNTVLNPVAHANNIISNLSMAHFAGVSYWDTHKYAGAVKDLTKNAPMVQEAKEAGLFLGTFSQGELVAAMPEQLRMLAGRVESRGAKAVDTVWSAMSFWLRKPMGKAYEAEDQFFRYLIYRDARQKGASPDEAVDYAQRYIFTYDNLPPGAKMIRDTALPFFAYTYKAVPAILRTAMEYPWRFAAPAGAFWAINTLMYALAFAADDDDEDDGALDVVRKYITDPQFREGVREKEKDERKNLPPWMKGMSMTMFTPKAIRLGMDEVTNMPVFLDISRIFPGGDLLDANNNSGGVPLFQPITPGSPVLTTAVAMLANRDMFFGRDLVEKELDTDAEAAAKRAAWMWRQVAPAIAVGNYHWDRAMNVIANLTGQPIEAGPISYTGQDKSGNPVQWEYATMQTFGIKARPIDPELSEAIEASTKKRILRELKSEIKKINRLEGKGYYSEENAERQRDNAREKIDRIRNGMNVDGDSEDDGDEE